MLICALVASMPAAIAAGIAQPRQVDHRRQHRVQNAAPLRLVGALPAADRAAP